MPENLLSLTSHCFIWVTLLLSTGCSVMQGNLMSSSLMLDDSSSRTRPPITAVRWNSEYVFFNGTKHSAATTRDAAKHSAKQSANPVASTPVAEQEAQPAPAPFPARLPEPERRPTNPATASSLTTKLIQTNSGTSTTKIDLDADADTDADVGRVRIDGVLPGIDVADSDMNSRKLAGPTTVRAAAVQRAATADDPATESIKWKESRTAEWKRVASHKKPMAGPPATSVVQISGRRPPVQRAMSPASRPGQLVPQPVPMPCPEGMANPCDCDPCEAATIHGDQISMLFKRVETMEADLKRSHQSISTLEKSLTVANTEIVRLKKDVDYWQTELSRLEASVQEQHHDDIEALGRVSEMLGLLIENSDVGTGNDFTAGSVPPGGATGLSITPDVAVEFAPGNTGGVQ